MILGAWIGLAVEERRVRFSTAGTFWRRALRLIIGLLVLVALRFGLKAIFPDDRWRSASRSGRSATP